MIYEKGTKQNVVGDYDLLPLIYNQGTKQNVVRDE